MYDGQPHKPLLSFAIPTYNFSRFIGETVDSIVCGAAFLRHDEYEIVILDGGSTDDTPQVLSEISRKYPNVRYKLNTVRGGIDRDLNEVAGMSRGDYIWLFSADDKLVDGWDKEISPLLKREKEIYLVPAELCDLLMSHLRYNPIFKADVAGPIEFFFNGDSCSIEEYLGQSNTLEALFSFMSAVIVRNDVWRELKERPDYYGSCWAHCARLLPLLFKKTTIVYVNKFLIKKRGGNDSFMENGFVSRIGIAVNGWIRIVFEFFNMQMHKQLLFQALRKDMPILLFVYAKITAKNKDEVRRLNVMCRDLYWVYSNQWKIRLNYVLYSLIPGATKLNVFLVPALPLLIRVRHKIKSLLSK